MLAVKTTGLCGLSQGRPAYGLAHGIGWILMSLACLYAVRTRVIPLRLGVAVAVIGSIGPFVGSYEFVREEGRRLRGDPTAG